MARVISAAGNGEVDWWNEAKLRQCVATGETVKNSFGGVPAGRHVAAAVLLLLLVSPLGAQSGAVMVTPFLANMVAGGSQLFRLGDLQGRPQQNVSWDISGPAATGVVEGNDLVVTGQEPGESRVVARSAAGRAEAKVTVLPGTSVPMGTVIWSAPSVPGCKPGKVVPAIPAASGVDVYQMSDCPDGEYLSAYTPEGMLAYRRKVSGAPGAPADAAPAGAENIAGPQTLNLHAASICDGVAVGTEQGKVREAMQVRGLKFSATSGQREVWLVEEPGVQCKLWFDENRALTKKQKILVAE